MAQAVPAEQKWWSGGKSPFNVEYGKLMMWFFLLSDTFSFSALLITYGFMRSRHEAFQGHLEHFKFSTEYWPIPEKVFTHSSSDLPLSTAL